MTADPPVTDDPPVVPDEAARPKASRMVPPEHIVAFVLAALAIPGFLAARLWGGTIEDQLGLVLLGAAFTAVLVVGASLRNRVIAGIGATLVAYGPWGDLTLLGLPYVGFAGIILFRLGRSARQLEPRRRPERPGRPKTAGRSAVKAPPARYANSGRVTPPGTRPRGRARKR